MSILLIPRVFLCVENLLSRYSCKFGPKCHADRNLGIYLREGKGSFEQCKNIKKSDEKCIFWAEVIPASVVSHDDVTWCIQTQEQKWILLLRLFTDIFDFTFFGCPSFLAFKNGKICFFPMQNTTLNQWKSFNPKTQKKNWRRKERGFKEGRFLSLCNEGHRLLVL